MKPKLVVVNLWGLGDVVIGTPFLRAVSERYEVTLVAKPYAQDLQVRFWDKVRVVPFAAPWTAFTHKYVVWAWPWLEILRLVRTLAAEDFQVGLSARWDPRDHLLLRLFGAKVRLGFPRQGSHLLLTRPLERPAPEAHQYEYWRVLARALDFELPPREKLAWPHGRPGGEVLVHTGAGQPVRVWLLERYRGLVTWLRREGYRVQVACDPDQHDWWLRAGEGSVAMPRSVTELLALADRAAAFIGNDSGPGHLAAFCGVPTFTIFGPQLPEWFAPLHPASEWLEGKACPYKPCKDYCQFASPCCLLNTGEDEVRARVQQFLARTTVRRAGGEAGR